MCNFCSKDIYIKGIQYLSPLLSPLTPAQALLDRAQDITGECYILLVKRYCPNCGAKMDGKEDADNAE